MGYEPGSASGSALHNPRRRSLVQIQPPLPNLEKADFERDRLFRFLGNGLRAMVARRAQLFITPGEGRWFKSSPRYQIQRKPISKEIGFFAFWTMGYEPGSASGSALHNPGRRSLVQIQPPLPNLEKADFERDRLFRFLGNGLRAGSASGSALCNPGRRPLVQIQPPLPNLEKADFERDRLFRFLGNGSRALVARRAQLLISPR
ncbi:hypothetical protein SAMN05421647_101938 [Marinobacterium stanieri]|uniref:Uncharacterized protein n=1 Tax=Marinobacterium stanieri TaxID=49186 RepID=A0A1N6PCD6_9GAMM|nr:hypothetical protein SAMN05421647_101938 [Marinobacterium stanieri]